MKARKSVADAAKLRLTMRILMIGDSLTAGMTSGEKDYPPAMTIKKLLGRGSHQIMSEGLGGDELLNMPQRLENILKVQSAKHRGKVDVCVLWGGTNDIRLGKTCDETFEHVLSCIEICKRFDCERIVIATLLEMSFENDGHGNISLNRKSFNDLVRNNSERCNYRVCDVAGAVPMLSLSESDRLIWFCDGLHLTKKGYGKVGKMLYDVIRTNGFLKKNV